MKPAMKAGFTLIELSIVLVIIGLIVGGVLVGRDLIKAAEARSIISDIEKYKTAVMTFRGKYDRLPGDCSNATTFFGASSNCGAGALAPGTCNGNGDGQITYLWPGQSDPVTGAVVAAGPTPSFTAHTAEDVTFWQQLSLAHMIEGLYSGVNGSAGFTYVVADNPVPFSSRISGACYGIMYGNDNSPGNRWGGLSTSENQFYFGGPGTPSVDVGCNAGIITPSQAYSIDSKIDDGMPTTGRVTNWPAPYDVGCVRTPVGAPWSGPTYTYITTNNGPLCSLIFSAGF
jgi:prepilin-type N-terminal cleavage/methylation domain-containing protein